MEYVCIYIGSQKFWPFRRHVTIGADGVGATAETVSELMVTWSGVVADGRQRLLWINVDPWAVSFPPRRHDICPILVYRAINTSPPVFQRA
jgi:hypothetical protein